MFKLISFGRFRDGVNINKFWKFLVMDIDYFDYLVSFEWILSIR